MSEKTPEKAKDKKSGSSENQEELEAIEPEELKAVQKGIEYMFQMRHSSGPFPPEILQKITPEHITSVIERGSKDDERNFIFAKSGRAWNFAYTVTGMLFFATLFIFLTIFLGERDLNAYRDILQDLFLFAAGFGSGFGIKAAFSKKSNN